MKVFDRVALAEVLKQGVAQLALPLSSAQQEQLLDYLALLNKWNSVYNLTSVRDPMQMMTLHLLDTLAAVPAFEGAQNVLDVGAGGGLPGVVLAIARPDMRVSMIDTVHKKTAFLTQVKAELGLANVTVYTKKVQELEVKQPFDVITSRAFADLSDFVNWSGHLLADGGRFIALKGHGAGGRTRAAAGAVGSERFAAPAGAGAGGGAPPGFHQQAITHKTE
jgi:16S rRNA (guanine527-N7)-methyltransferase